MSEITAEMIERGRGKDPRKASKRRMIADSVRNTREQLTSSGSGLRGFDVELIRQYAQTRQIAAPASVGLSLVVAAISTMWVSPLYALFWLTMISSAALFGYGQANKYLERDDTDIDVHKWQRRFVLSELLQSMSWGLLILLLLHVRDADARTFVLFILLLVAAMSAMMSAAIPHAVYSGMLPITLAIVIFMQMASDFRALPITIMAIIAQVYFIILAKRLYQGNIASLLLQREKDGLIGELEYDKLNSDEARRRAEEANLAKSRFLATMSHELRTPLNAILGFSEVMKNELFGTHSVPSYKDYSNDIHSSGQHLLMLINEILDLSRVEAGRYDLKEEAVSLPAIVEDCVHLLNMRSQKREITMIQVVEDTLPRIWADERAVRQITLNLLTNAIKFTPQGGKITIKAGWTSSGGQYISIRDTGPGIPEDEIPVVLSSFGRGSMAQKNADEGSGLGLPIVKGLVELHGGTFQLKSKVRVGTEVITIFPPQRVMNALPRVEDDFEPAAAAPKKKKGLRRKAA
ncbi:MAG: sensor histidine kinase [Beijerinckiaceae bacterium]